MFPALTALSSSVGVARGGGDVDGLSSSGADHITRALQSLVGDDAVNFCDGQGSGQYCIPRGFKTLISS